MDIVSQSALRVARLVWRPGHGGFSFTLVCKATFSLQPDLSPLAPVQEPVVEADVPGVGGAIVAASQLVPFKKRPEVLITGHAYAPEGRLVTSLVARIVVGEIDKAVQVVGDRNFGLDGRLGEPSAFAKMPLGWERAAGGPDTYNPAGKAIGSSAHADFFGRVPAPNLLPPGAFLASRSDIVQTVGFGPIAPTWPSRAACLHRHATDWDPARWHERSLPADIDLAYFNAAPPDQQRTAPFGDDQLYLEHLHPTVMHLSTRLAPVTPTATVDQGAGPQPLQLRCDTLIIDTDRALAMLVWRAHVLLDRPDRAGRVVVTGPGEPQARLPSWVQDVPVSMSKMTVSADQLGQSSRDLPFAASSAPSSSATPRVRAGAPDIVPPSGVVPPSIVPRSAALTPSGGIRLGGPPPSGSEYGKSTNDDAPETPRSRGGYLGAMTLTGSFALVSASEKNAAALPFAETDDEEENTAVQRSPVADRPGLRFSGMADEDSTALRKLPVPERASTLPFAGASGEDSTALHKIPVIADRTSTLPFAGAAGEDSTALHKIPIADRVSALPFAAHPPEAPPPAPAAPIPGSPWAATGSGYPPSPPPDPGYAGYFASSAEPSPTPWMPEPQSAYPAPPPPEDAPVPLDEPPVPPDFAGAPGLVSDAHEAAPAPPPDAPKKEDESDDPDAEEKAPDPAAEPTVDFDAYPPARCGSIAARVGLDEAGTPDILRAEKLDTARWERVHEHWLERIDKEVARSRPALRTEYDTAYVDAIEEECGALTVETYAELAEAAERDEIEDTLAARKLPADAWPPIHRVWLKRMIQDARKAKEVRAAVQTIRASMV